MEVSRIGLRQFNTGSHLFSYEKSHRQRSSDSIADAIAHDVSLRTSFQAVVTI
ncbi:hypothetical protein M407DRAFT_186204 [Tulasnella calospora MUT 4182]|uniref:Uncharacterized protein n=1 Tax=Tulasnella calospora MUT 4182 TaxID=1051891 RepID=A0A0C3QLG4_9AGAM|nr:hypothetical protein M407DRAFT_186204 [Tulasnella calospora MUT 4182]